MNFRPLPLPCSLSNRVARALPMLTLRPLLACALAMAAACLYGCGNEDGGPIRISAIGGPPRLVNVNRFPLDPPSALLMETTAQGLVRFEQSGHIEPALAQRWIVSDDGLRYTFRLAPVRWASGEDVSADQVVARLRAAIASSSRNPLKPVLGGIDEIEAMTDDVLEISLNAPRPYFLELLAQPELGIVRNGQGSGPFRATEQPDGALRLEIPEPDEEEERPGPPAPRIILRGERAALAVARFKAGGADLVTGGNAGDLLVARAAELPTQALHFDPVSGLFGLMFLNNRGLLGDVEARHALSMAIDRDALVTALGVPALQPRTSLLPPNLDELPQPAVPAWTTLPLAERRARAARTIADLEEEEPPRIRVAVPESPGYRVVFAHLRRDWQAIGVSAEAVAEDAAADVRLIDEVAPANMASWYLLHFTCRSSRVCSSEADAALDSARNATDLQEQRALLATADRLLEENLPFIALTAPVRWYLVGSRLTGFRPSPLGRHPVDHLIAVRR